MIGALTFAASLLAGLGVWLLGMRPYLQRHGRTVVTGATLWLGAWADWQQCRDFARANQDSGASRWSNIFLLTQIGMAVGITLAICQI
jgi:hypothetical protein